jgi:hypothetical protein
MVTSRPMVVVSPLLACSHFITAGLRHGGIAAAGGGKPRYEYHSKLA